MEMNVNSQIKEQFYSLKSEHTRVITKYKCSVSHVTGRTNSSRNAAAVSHVHCITVNLIVLMLCVLVQFLLWHIQFTEMQLQLNFAEMLKCS